jgi:hypothetical protein
LIVVVLDLQCVGIGTVAVGRRVSVAADYPRSFVAEKVATVVLRSVVGHCKISKFFEV